MYRDFFEIVTPASYYLMALLYRVFGPNIETARAATAVIHGVDAVLIYVLARCLGVRTGIAAIAAVAPLAVAYPAFPQASPHWFGALLTVVLAVVVVVRRDGRMPRWWLVPGVVVGLLVATQQQKGIVVGVTMGAWVLGETWYDADRSRVGRALAAGSWFAAGILVVVVPPLIVMLAVAGLQPLLDALMRPYAGYRQFHGGSELMTWGWGLWVSWWQMQFLRAPPLAIVPGLARARWQATH